MVSRAARPPGRAATPARAGVTSRPRGGGTRAAALLGSVAASAVSDPRGRRTGRPVHRGRGPRPRPGPSRQTRTPHEHRTTHDRTAPSTHPHATFLEQPPVANIKSQIKRIATNEKARLRNKAVKSELKTVVRQFREAVEAGDGEKTQAALARASRRLDKAVTKGVIHKNQAANRKASMAKRAAAV